MLDARETPVRFADGSYTHGGRVPFKQEVSMKFIQIVELGSRSPSLLNINSIEEVWQQDHLCYNAKGDTKIRTTNSDNNKFMVRYFY